MLTWISSKHVDTKDKNQQELDDKCIKTVQALDDKLSLYTHGNKEQQSNTWIHKQEST